MLSNLVTFIPKLFNHAHMVKAYDSRFKPSLNLDKVTVSFDKLINIFNIK